MLNNIPVIKTEKLIRILEKLGFTVDKGKGKGSHVKIFGKDGKFTIAPRSLDSISTRKSIAKFLISQGIDINEIKW